MEWFEAFLSDPVWYCVKVFAGLIGIGILMTIVNIINMKHNEK